ncbi:uncharacterized protein MELLADRAFT_114727 [Melampsora larici-populina 98AG31]|uniref:Uncharacterized protein n=1 Tax=Melampsora larici-populina (strain 98AG31 / pathotype 3-4-7) TaxID=747676 RepID=F4SEJ2_MELLP|nr:uncharacterized protein MELLADRAFT_114727 [Melampsora larici-populina 98AG31]EGF96932.1 hypothetical protein MELLADRAFT_114727 [Melampsora larici-populina 98AG31]
MARSNSKRKYDSKKRTQKNKATEKQHNKLKVAREISRRNQIACEYGLPDTAKFFFLEKKPSSVPRKLFHHGIVVLVDKKSLELLLIAQFNEFSDMHPELLVQFESSISTFYLHGISRGFVKNNGATCGVNRPGDMRAMGWRSAAGVAADVGKDVCHYSLNQATSKSEGKIWIDIERNSLLLPQAKDFWAERFSILSMLVKLGKALKLKKSRMSRKAWELYTKDHIKGYDQQVYVKLDKLSK